MEETMPGYVFAVLGVIFVILIVAAIYGRATVEVVKDVGIVNPLTISLAVIVVVGILIELATKSQP